MFGENLKTLRKNLGISQETLSEQLGTARSSICNWEMNRSTPDYDMLIKIANYFGVTIDYLLGKDENIDPIEKLRQALKEAGLYNGDNDMSEEDFKKALRIVEMLKKDTK